MPPNVTPLDRLHRRQRATARPPDLVGREATRVLIALNASSANVCVQPSLLTCPGGQLAGSREL